MPTETDHFTDSYWLGLVEDELGRIEPPKSHRLLFGSVFGAFVLLGALLGVRERAMAAAGDKR